MNYIKLAATGVAIGLVTVFLLLPLSILVVDTILGFLPTAALGGFASLVSLILYALILGVMVILALGMLVKLKIFSMSAMPPTWVLVQHMKSCSYAWI